MKMRKIAAVAAAVALVSSGMMFAAPAFADDTAPPPEEAVTQVVDEAAAAPAEEVATEEPVAEPVAEEGPAEAPATEEAKPAAPAAPAQQSKPAAQPQSQPDFICDEDGEGWQAKVDWDGDGNPTVTAPEGFLIDAYCVKAGTTKHIVEVTPPASSVEIDHPIKDSVSHYQVHLIPVTVEPQVTSLSGPVVKDKCGTEDDHYGLPAEVEGVTFTRDGKDIIATVAEGYVVEEVPAGWVSEGEGVYRYAFNAEQFTDEPCEQGPSCTTVTGAVTIEGDGVIDVPGGWVSNSIDVPLNGVATLADIGTVLDIQATPIQYVGLHIDTAQGTIVFEEEPSYGGNLWSTSAWDGVSAGMGYAAFGSIEEYIAQNGDVEVTGIRLLYTHPEASSTTVESFTIGCTLYTFEPVVDYPVPALFNAPAEGPTCDTAGTFSTAFLGEPDDGPNWYEFENVWVYVDRSVEGEVYLYIEAKEGFNLTGLSDAWTILNEWSAERTIVLEGPLGYQSENPEAVCYQVAQPAAPTWFENCGTDNDTWVVPGNTDEFYYEVTEEGSTVTITANLRSENLEWAEGVTTSWSHTFTDEDCPVTPTPEPSTPPLAATGGGGMSPLIPLGGGTAVMLGLVLGAIGMLRRRMA